MSKGKPSPLVRGDFQTPTRLATEVWASLGALDEVGTVIEPTVGQGSFLKSAPETLRGCRWVCFDLNAGYVECSRTVARERGFENVQVTHANVFDLSPGLLASIDPNRPVLAIGNPPWVTSAGQGRVKIQNLPKKSNAGFGLAGLDALTGKANFDTAEAVLLKLLDAVGAFNDVRIAFLVKRSVAMKLSRRLLGSASELSFTCIDAAAHFGVSVDAGLFVARLEDGAASLAEHVDVATELGAKPTRKAGFRRGRFVEDLDQHSKDEHLETDVPVPWRQGVKHDASKVLELLPEDGRLMNGFGEAVLIESDLLCPLYKGSDIANGREPSRLFPLFQLDLSGPLPDLQVKWPLLASYLSQHEALFAARRSRIYQGKPPFSIFGIGAYTIAAWKVVVSGLYSSADFRVIGPSRTGRPSLVDDTCYLLPFDTKRDAQTVAAHLNGARVQRLIRSLMDEKAKRPITKALLSRIEVPLEPTERVSVVEEQQKSTIAA